MQSHHIVNAYDQELRQLQSYIAEMGGQAEQQLREAMRAIVERDSEIAGKVVREDAILDELERKVEAQTIRLLALRQPMARDLREVISALKVASNLERIGDFAANVAKRSLALQQMPEVGLTRSLGPLGQTAAEMLNAVVQAYLDDDLDGAMKVRERDQDLDRAYTALFRELLTYMMETPQRITACTHLLFAAKNLERIGDHATNVAESVCFRIRGRLPDEDRLKSDESSFAVLAPGTGPDGAATP